MRKNVAEEKSFCAIDEAHDERSKSGNKVLFKSKALFLRLPL